LNICFLFLPLFLCLFSLSLFVDYRKIPKISPGAYIFQRPFLRGLFLEGLIFGGLCTEENLRSKVDCVSLLWEGNLPFLLCFALYSRENSKYKPPGGLYSEGRFNGGFLALRFWGAYTWRGLLSDFFGNLMMSFLLTISCVFCLFLSPFVPLISAESRP